MPSHITFEKGKYRLRYKKSKKYPYEINQYFNTLGEAIKAKEEYLAKITLNIFNVYETKNISFSEFCDYFLDWYKNKSKRPSHNTLRGYTSKINRLKELFGNVNLADITTYQIELILAKEKNRFKFSNGKSHETISAHTIHHEYTMLRMIFNKAYEWKFISENPIQNVEEPYFEEKTIEVPEYEELETIEEQILTAPIRERCQFLLAFYTGMREEEVCGVHIEDIDFIKKNVKVKRAIVQDSFTKKYIEDKTKSQTSVRTIPLPNKFFSVLNEYYKYRDNLIEYLKIKTGGNYKEIPNVFLNKDGDFYRPNRLSRMWAKFAKANNIKLTYHGLRHYYLTNQMNYNDNLSPRDVQEIAGHANIKTTFKYVHPSEKRISDNATNLFSKFSKEELYKDNENTLTIPINHIATIILGKPILTNAEDLQITLSELSDDKVDLFNISTVMEKCKEYLENNYPSLKRITNYSDIIKDNKELINKLKIDYGNYFEVEKLKNEELSYEM